jgi:hypothetical protein
VPWGAFGPIEALQYPGIHQLDLSASPIGGLPSTRGFPTPLREGFKAGAGLLWLSLTATSLASQLDPDAKLLWNGMPIPTDVQLTDSTESADGTVYFYRLTAAVPSSLQTAGGAQQLSFVSAGINATETLLATPLTLLNPLPVLADAMVLTASNAASPGAKLFVSGGGFTEDSVVHWDGRPRVTAYQSASGLLADLASSNLVAGDHVVTVVNPPPGGGTSNAFVHTTTGPIALPFATFSAKLEIIRASTFDEQATFELGVSSNGLDPVRETTTFTAWTHTTVLPPGSWRAKRSKYPGEWVFKGVVDGVTLELKLTQVGPMSYVFRAEGSGASLAGQGHPVFVTLTIGDDSGTTEARADFHAK